MRFITAEHGHVVNVIPATTTAGAADLTGNYIGMENYGHVDFIVSFGSTAASSTILVYEITTNAGESTTAIGFSYYFEEVDGGDTLQDRASTASTGLSTPATDRVFVVVPVDANQLTDGYPYLCLHVNAGGANTVSAIAVMSGARYAQENSLTAIT